jgi:hypothetical protein
VAFRYFDLMGRHPTTPAAIAALESSVVPPGARRSWLSAMVRHAPERVLELLRQALRTDAPATEIEELFNCLDNRNMDRFGSLAELPQPQREALVAAAYQALHAYESPGGYADWHRLATMLSALPAPLPPCPVVSPEVAAESAARSARLNAVIAASEAVREALASGVVLTREVWVDALRIPEGPPAMLFGGLAAYSVPIYVSEPLIEAVATAFVQLGWASSDVETARARMRAVGTLRAGADEVELAVAAGLGSVYTVGPRTGTTVGAITFRPVHELLSVTT